MCRTKRISRHLIRGMIPALLMAAVLLSGCGKKPEEERNSLVITAAETAATFTVGAGTDISGKTTDTVNGFRFETCDEMVYCTGDGVKLRKKPGLDGEVVGYLDRGAYVHRVGKNIKWSRIQRDGKWVYISADYLSANPPPTLEPPETQPAETSGSETKKAAEGEEEPEAADT